MHAAITKLAWLQHGAFSIVQAESAGVSRSSISRYESAGLIERRAPGVYCLTCAPPTWRQAVMIHLLAAGTGALATGDSALALWCPELDPPKQPVIAVPVNCGYRTTSARVWRSSDLDLAIPTIVDGVPTVNLARALLDAAPERTVDDMVARINACQRHRPLVLGPLVDVLQSHERPGRPGTTTFRGAVAALTAEVPDSEFERLVVRDVERAGLPEPRLHHVVRLRQQRPIELDLDWPGIPLDVELDGRDHSTRAHKARRDRQRDRLLQSAGYQVLRYTWADYLEDGPGMIAEIGSFLRRHSAARVSGGPVTLT